MQKARRHTSEEMLRPLVSVWFQVLLTSLIGELFTVQSPYWSTIGHRGVFSLGGWAPHVQAEFHELDPTLGLPHYAATGLSPSAVHLSSGSRHYEFVRFRSPLLTESRLFSFPLVT